MNRPAQGSIQIIGIYRHAAKLIILIQVSVDPLHFIIGQFHIHPVHRIHQVGKCLEIHYRITVHIDSQILLHRLQKKLGPAEGIGRVQTVALSSRNIHIHITQQGGHMNRPRLITDGKKYHGIRSSFIPCCPGIASYKQDVHHTLFLQRLTCQRFHTAVPHFAIYMSNHYIPDSSQHRQKHNKQGEKFPEA